MPDLLNLWAFCVLAVVLVASSVTDVRKGKIPNIVTYPAIVVGLVGHALVGLYAGENADAMGFAGSAAGLAAGFLPMLAFWLCGGVGAGDAKLMAAVGALSGWRFALSAMFYGFAVAAIMAIIVAAHKRVLIRTLKRVGRTVYLAFTPGKPTGPDVTDSPKVPIGLAMCIGAAVALAWAAWQGPGAPTLLLGI